MAAVFPGFFLLFLVRSASLRRGNASAFGIMAHAVGRPAMAGSFGDRRSQVGRPAPRSGRVPKARHRCPGRSGRFLFPGDRPDRTGRAQGHRAREPGWQRVARRCAGGDQEMTGSARSCVLSSWSRDRSFSEDTVCGSRDGSGVVSAWRQAPAREMQPSCRHASWHRSGRTAARIRNRAVSLPRRPTRIRDRYAGPPDRVACGAFTGSRGVRVADRVAHPFGDGSTPGRRACNGSPRPHP